MQFGHFFWFTMNTKQRTKQRIGTVIKKTLAGFLAGVFLFTSTFSWAQEEKLFSAGTENRLFSSGPFNQSDLAVPTKLTEESFREKFRLMSFLLRHKVTNAYLERQIAKEKDILGGDASWEEERVFDYDINDFKR